MPNFDLAKFNAIPEKCLSFSDRKNSGDRTNYQNQTSNIVRLAKSRSLTIRFLFKEDKKRLKVVSFILNQINIILLNTFADHQNYPLGQKFAPNQLETQNIPTSSLIKASFLQDSEIILLCICQAILIADKSILKNSKSPEFQADLSEFELPVEQSCLIDLIKTSVIEFIYSITLDSSQNINTFASEVASYFEMAITLMNQLPQS
ncbi:hypothetical protein I4641_08385 [Waterburya agarophytonicola K14]|uniref:Uncharacterized protein n=2 Tax=Waterburya TaxID=2886915 RepID=A0A964BR47_9CYAN|nr:hypothetical protein [Waterburya agarophytonicola KI4]